MTRYTRHRLETPYIGELHRQLMRLSGQVQRQSVLGVQP
jgi:hypothetical protein